MYWARRWAAIAALGVAWGLGCTVAPAAAAASDSGYVLGDSIGEGVAMASGLTKLAQISVRIRDAKVIAQISRTPVGSRAYIVLGTNDAVGSLKNIESSIDAVVRAGESRKLRMVWIGPPCVRRDFDSRSRDLDAILRSRLAGTSVRYVSMRDARLCGGALHQKDGVHFTMAGYRYIWNKAEDAVPRPHLASSSVADAGIGVPRPAADSATGSIGAAVPKISAIVSPGSESTGTGLMLAEVHRPPRALSLPIIWTRVSE